MTAKSTPKPKQASKSLKPAKSNKKSAPPVKKKDQNTAPAYLKFVYGFMLLLMLLGGFARITGRNRRAPATTATPSAQVVFRGTAAKVLTYHRENAASNLCDDLTITTAGDAVLANCSGSREKQYRLTDNERKTLTGWLEKFKPFDYDPGDHTQISFTGHGAQIISETELKYVLTFASEIEAEIAAEP